MSSMRMERVLGQSEVKVVPITLRKANDYIAEYHRHHGKLPNGMAWWCVAAITDSALVGVAIAGRPSNRNNDDGQTVEVHRVCTDGTPNAPSALYGACARAAKAIGARRILTYTLESEPGTSLKAAGWVKEAGNIKSSWAINAREYVDVDGILVVSDAEDRELEDSDCTECFSRSGRWHAVGCSRRKRKIVDRPHLKEKKARWAVNFRPPIEVKV